MCNSCALTNVSEKARTEAFGQKLIQTLNGGALSIMLSIGHRTGLFDTMSELPAADSAGIAKAAGLNERYVREWLGAMVASEVIEYDSANKTYKLPAEHAALLTRAAGADNIATLAQYMPLLGTVEDKVIKCFYDGGGVPYSEFTRFQEVMADDSGQSVLPALHNHILPLIPGIKEKLKSGIKAADVGCGRGKALTMLAEYYPKSEFTGFEISKEALEWARNKAAEKNLKNIKFEYCDAAKLSSSSEYDFIMTFDAIHDQAEPQKVLENIHRALKPGGYYMMQDIGLHTEVADNITHPIGTAIYTISCLHCMTVSLANNGAGLGAAWGVELAEEMLSKAGFTDISVHRLAHDIQNAYFVQQKN